MQESCMYGSVRGAPSNGRLYRDRREFITLLGGAAALWPLAARAAAQADADRCADGFAESDPRVAAFPRGTPEARLAESRNIGIEYRWTTPSDVESRERSAKELVALQPDLILSHGTPNTAAPLQQTRTIPIVFAAVSDPVGNGFVASFP
jgi:putative ABC transport system substrate-binding protein